MNIFDKIIKGLECCINSKRTTPDCDNCPYKDIEGTCTNLHKLHEDALTYINGLRAAHMATLENLNKLYDETKNKVDVVRCRDCKHFVEHNDGQGGNCNHLDYDGEYEFSVAGDWFCADGKRRETTLWQ